MKFENLKLKNIDYVIRFSSKSKKWTAKNRLNHIIGFQMAGKAVHDFGYQQFTLGENCLYFLNQKDDFTVKVLEEPHAYSVHFTTYEDIETDSFCIKINNVDEIERLLEKIERQKNLSPIADNLTSSYFYRLCSMFDEICKKNYAPADARVKDAKEYMDLHFKEKDCLDNVYTLCNVSKRRFNDLFKNAYNITPNRYIVERKTDLAKQLLKTSNLSVREIAEACGFNDTYYFCKVFKSETGCTAKEFKNL